MPQVVRYGLVLICLLGGFTQVWAETRTALVIGNSAYRDAPLKNPANDATDVAKLLRSLEFDVVLKTNATQEAMEDAIRDFGKALEKKGGVGLFFYAGHGVQSQGKNYLIPVDAQLEREKDLRYRAVNLGQLLDEMRFAKNGLNIAILDACRNNPLTRSFRSSERGLAPMTDAPKGLFLAYSTSPNEVAADGEGRNSPFTEQLKLALTKPGLPLELTFKEVVKGVKKVTQEKQVPWFNSSVSGDFYFKPATPAQAPVVTPTIGPSAVPGKAVDALAWSYVENSQDIRDFAAFQKQFPKSQYTFLARMREQQLKKASLDKVLQASAKNSKDKSISLMEEPLVDGRYHISKDGTVTDVETGLQWMRCSLGQQLNEDICTGSANDYSWQGAKDAARTLNKQGGYAELQDWRVPNMEELASLAYCSSGKPDYWAIGEFCEGDFRQPTISVQAFPNTPSSFFWSSTPNANHSGSAWGVYFDYGNMHSGSARGFGQRVRLVRGGQ